MLGTETGTAGVTVIRAEVPAAELVRYVVDLRSLSSGTAAFTRRPARFEPVPEGTVLPG